MKVSRIVQENIAYMNELLPVQESYDIVERDIVIGGRERRGNVQADGHIFQDYRGSDARHGHRIFQILCLLCGD